LSVQGVARRYATALADVVLKRRELGKLDDTATTREALQVQRELSDWAAMMQSHSQLLEVFRNPVIAYEQKHKVLNALITRTRVQSVTANFLHVLLRNHRLTDLNVINQSFARELDARAGIVSAHVTTARPISQQAQENLRARLTLLTRQNVRLEFAVDEALIGGIVTRIGSTVYDGSVRTRLQQIKQQMAGGQ
jgi:F-type H+-transporting ATPase subunit delta